MKKVLKIVAILTLAAALAFTAFCVGIVYTMENQKIYAEGEEAAANIEGWEWYYTTTQRQ